MNAELSNKPPRLLQRLMTSIETVIMTRLVPLEGVLAEKLVRPDLRRGKYRVKGTLSLEFLSS